MMPLRFVLAFLLCGTGPATAWAEPAWPCTWGDVDCLLREGGARLDARQLDEAYLFFEQAAFLAPDDARVRRGLGETLLRLGASNAAVDLLAKAETGSHLLRAQRLEFALGYGDNRNQLPSLSELRLTMPGYLPTTLPLDKALRPDPGPVYWAHYALRQSDGLAVSLGGNASLDQRLGVLWARAEQTLDDGQRWSVRGEYSRRLEDGWQALLGLRRRFELGAGMQGDAEISLREESVAGRYHFIESRLGVYREIFLGALGVGVTRAAPLGQQPPGGGQWRGALIWGMQGRQGQALWSFNAMWRTTIDDDPYHPLLAEGRSRWQTGRLYTLGGEYPLGQGLALWSRVINESLRSNVELFAIRRNEYLVGISSAW